MLSPFMKETGIYREPSWFRTSLFQFSERSKSIAWKSLEKVHPTGQPLEIAKAFDFNTLRISQMCLVAPKGAPLCGLLPQTSQQARVTASGSERTSYHRI
jgi:hypothetical protein